MCRLSAYSKDGKIESPDVFMFGVLMLLSARKGNTDGTGVAINHPGHEGWLKSGAEASEVVFKEKWKEAWKLWSKRSKDFNTIFGHNRLASAIWKPAKANENLSMAHAHPHIFGQVVGMHNGNFKDYQDIAKKIGEHEEYIDTQYFYDFLSSRINGSLSVDDVVNTLLEVGEAEYSLLMRHINQPEVLVFRGNRPLFSAESNYGIFINTERENLVELNDMVNPALEHFGYPVLDMKTPTYLPEYTAYKLEAGVLEKLVDFDEVKEINSPPVTTTYYSRNVAANKTETLDGVEIAARANLLSRLFAINPAAHEEDYRLTANELYNENFCDIAWIDSSKLDHLAGLMEWATETENGVYAPTEEKNHLWFKFTASLRTGDEHLAVKDEYKFANDILDVEFDIPFWHNELKILKQLGESI